MKFLGKLKWENKKDRGEHDQVSFIQSMQKLEIMDGDIVVLKFPQKLPAEEYRNFKDAIQETLKEFGHDIHVLILEDGIDIGVLTKPKGEN